MTQARPVISIFPSKPRPAAATARGAERIRITVVLRRAIEALVERLNRSTTHGN